MYDELIKRLRELHPEEFGNQWDFAFACQQAMHEAADAIENMSEYVNTMMRLKCEGWYLQQTKFHNGYQALTTMPLPEPPKEET